MTDGATCFVPFLAENDCAEVRCRKAFRFAVLGQAVRKSLSRSWMPVVLLGVGLIFLSTACLLLVHAPPRLSYEVLSAQSASIVNSNIPTSVSRSNDLSLWTSADFELDFNAFVETHKKVYANASEREHRLRIYRQNLSFIYTHNAQNLTYSLAMNKFGDLTYDEFHSFYNSIAQKNRSLAGGRPQHDRPVAWQLADAEEHTIPTSIDWRDSNCVTPVKNQEKCGSCWAFSTTGAVEGALCAANGFLPSLSEQQLVDCAGIEGNEGCNGGEADRAFAYVIENQGLCAESAYPYTSHEIHFCAAKDCKPVGKISSFVDVPPMDDKALRAAVARHGPVSVAIEADQSFFQFYNTGVFSGPCGTVLDHAVLVVGFGRDPVTGLGYFIVKNSWGSDWGEDGYIRMVRGKASSWSQSNASQEAVNEKTRSMPGECGILMEPSFAVAA